MMNEIRERYLGMAAICFGLSSALIYVLMIAVTLAHIENISGHVPFDMRPFGYSPSDAAALLDALGAGGRNYYLTRQIPLDTAYPTLMALTLVCTMYWFGRGLPHRNYVRFGVFLAISAAAFDQAENMSIIVMICSWPNQSMALVHLASTATLLKSMSTTLAVLQTLVLGILWARLRPIQDSS